MKTPPPRSPELEAWLAPHRAVLPLAPSVEARASARAVAATESLGHTPARASGRAPWVLAVAAGVVLAFGAGAYAAWIAVPSQRAPADVNVKPIASARASDPQLPVVATTAEVDVPTPPHARRSVGRTSAPTIPTNAELQMLRAARQDVTRGDFAGALAVIAEHVRRFRHGSLVEEREALRVKSLGGLGRHEEAQRAAADFHRRFPHSVLLSTFERLTEADR